MKKCWSIYQLIFFLQLWMKIYLFINIVFTGLKIGLLIMTLWLKTGLLFSSFCDLLKIDSSHTLMEEDLFICYCLYSGRWRWKKWSSSFGAVSENWLDDMTWGVMLFHRQLSCTEKVQKCLWREMMTVTLHWLLTWLKCCF